MRTELHPTFDIDRKLYFLLICVITLLLLFLKKNFVELNITAFEFMEANGENSGFHVQKWLQYVSIPMIYAFKFMVISFVLWAGCFMFGYSLPYKQAWSIVMVAELVFFIPEIIKLFYFMFGADDPTIWDVRNFYPFSLANLIDLAPREDPRLYPAKALNIFEIIYWLVLVYGIYTSTLKSKKISFLIVFTTYVPLFFIWLAVYYRIVL